MKRVFIIMKIIIPQNTNIENKLDLDIDYLWAGSTGGGSSLAMIFHNGVDDNEISKVENMQ